MGCSARAFTRAAVVLGRDHSIAGRREDDTGAAEGQESEFGVLIPVQVHTEIVTAVTFP